MDELADMSIETGYKPIDDIQITIRKVSTLCMPGLIQDTLANKAVDLNEAIRHYWLARIKDMAPKDLIALLHKYAPLDTEADNCKRKLEE